MLQNQEDKALHQRRRHESTIASSSRTQETTRETVQITLERCDAGYKVL